MKYFVLIFFLCIATNMFAQIKYEKGYLINNHGEKIKILLLNEDWGTNPTEFSYKLSESGSVEKGNIKEIKEFGAGNYLKYKRFSTSIDRSGNQVSNMSKQAAPEFEEKTVFLQQLVSGKADLYAYRNGSLERFFINTPASGLEPLIYKEYLKGNGIAINNQYRQRLYSLASCGENSADQIRAVSYNKRELINYFVKYNKCQLSEYHVFVEQEKRIRTKFSLQMGLDYRSIKIEEGIHVKGFKSEPETLIRLGGEIEFVMPFNRNKWSFFVGPSYTDRSFEGNDYIADGTYSSNPVDIFAEFKTITIATGLRHFLFLNDYEAIFLTGGISLDWNFHTHVLIDRGDRYELDPELDSVNTKPYYSLGIGYRYHRLRAEIRYNTPKVISGKHFVPRNYDLQWKSREHSVSLNVGYTLF